MIIDITSNPPSELKDPPFTPTYSLWVHSNLGVLGSQDQVPYNKERMISRISSPGTYEVIESDIVLDVSENDGSTHIRVLKNGAELATFQSAPLPRKPEPSKNPLSGPVEDPIEAQGWFTVYAAVYCHNFVKDYTTTAREEAAAAIADKALTLFRQRTR